MSPQKQLSDGFPYKTYPSGWFQIAWMDELQAGDSKALKYFGRDLVLYRGKTGKFHLLDAFCPHMGAHLGVGGRVMGDNIVCPYHAWVWNGQGKNVAIPLEDGPTDRCSIQSWKTTTANGIVWMWFDELGREPFFDAPTDLPGVAEGKRHTLFPRCTRVWRNVRMRPQYVPENNVDLEHIRVVHGARGPLECLGVEDAGFCLKIRNRIIYGYGKKSTGLTPDGPIDVEVYAELWGLGFQYTFFPLPDEAVSIQSQTPVDHEHCDMFQSVIVYCSEGDQPDDEPSGFAHYRVKEQLVQIERDIPIWENMTYLENPSFSEPEKAVMLPLRQWARKFYPEH